jgi:hypothetical protein
MSDQNLKPVIEKLINKICILFENQKILFEQDEAQEELIKELSESLSQKINQIENSHHNPTNLDKTQEKLLESLFKKLNQLENNFEELNKCLAKGTYPIKLTNAVKITESFIPIKINPINISPTQLVETYNEVVNLLSGYAITVSLTPESYRQLNQNQIILEKSDRGNYWLLATLEKEQYKYWLVPSPKINFNIHKLKTIQTLFQLEGESSSLVTEFSLQQPATLSLLPNGKEWRLDKPGILVFGKNSQSISLKVDLLNKSSNEAQVKINEQIASTLATFTSTVEQLNSKVIQLESQLNTLKQTYNQEKQDWLAEKETWQQIQEATITQAEKVNSWLGKVMQEGKQTIPKHLNSEKAEPKDNLTEFRRIYRQDRKIILDRLIAKVSITVEALENILLGNSEKIILQNAVDGKYWIIEYSNTYYLIPQENIKITHGNLNVLQALFDYCGYYSEYSHLELIKPAQVSKISSTHWVLEERGKLEFS